MAQLPPDFLLPAYGSLVGAWMVRGLIGLGSHGVVFRVVHKDRPEAESYALKLALTAGDERFEREAHLLSRVRHSSVPRFEGNGTWTNPRGELLPYVVMQWVEGLLLYAWALEHGLTLRQAISLLAQVARALEATHRHGVHRDVKGGNIRVSAEGHAVLLDFGSCWYPSASPLTGREMPPGTPRYRSPQLLFFEYVRGRGWEGYYEAQPADDVYALGVTAYRLLAGGYPPSDSGSAKAVPLEAPRGLNAVCPELGELIVRLLSEDPEARGSAKVVAEELEALREDARPELDEPWEPNPSRQPTRKARPPARREHPLPPMPPKQALPPVPPEREWRELAPRLALAGGCLLVALLCVLLPRDVNRGEVAYTDPQSESQAAEQPDAGTSLGTEGMASVSPAETPPAFKERVSNSTNPVPEKPEPGQKRPPCNRSDERAINGGCWAPLARKPPCEEFYEHDGECYAPVMLGKRRQPTSDDP